jgi:hypothetical protein
MNGKALPFKVQANGEDQHLSLRFPVSSASNSVVIRVKNDFGLALANELPPLGSTSRGLRVISNSWNSERSQLTLEVSGRPGMSYELEVWNPAQIGSVDGAILTQQGNIRVETPAEPRRDYSHRTVVIHFAES